MKNQKKMSFKQDKFFSFVKKIKKQIVNNKKDKSVKNGPLTNIIGINENK